MIKLDIYYFVSAKPAETNDAANEQLHVHE